jgi:hypothetical protein
MLQWRFGYCSNLVERLAGAREILERYVARLLVSDEASGASRQPTTSGGIQL